MNPPLKLTRNLIFLAGSHLYISHLLYPYDFLLAVSRWACLLLDHQERISSTCPTQKTYLHWHSSVFPSSPHLTPRWCFISTAASVKGIS